MEERNIQLKPEPGSLLNYYQVLYLDTPSNPVLSEDDYLHYKDKSEDYGMEFLYIPEMLKNLPSSTLNYFAPGLSGKPDVDAIRARLAKEFGISGPSLIFHSEDSWEEFTLVELQESSIDEVIESMASASASKLRFYSESSFTSDDESEHEILYELKFDYVDETLPHKSIVSDEWEDSDVNRIIAELMAVNEQALRDIGLSESALRYILNLKEGPSRMRIDRHSKIILDDFKGMEIKMDDKTKALYFLFLRHPEGLSIKELPEHINELLDLYQSISGRDNPEAMRKTIEDLANPFKNDVNISLSRIKKAFCKAFCEHIARNYYISGKKGGLRKIPLDRDLVTWETIR